MKITVEVKKKPGVIDAEGKATEKALKLLGFKVSSVSVGKKFFIETTEPKKVRQMCEKLLVNPVIEEYSVSE